MHLHDAFDILRSDDGGPARLLLSDDAAQVDDTVANDYAQAEGAPVVLLDRNDDTIANIVVVGGWIGRRDGEIAVELLETVSAATRHAIDAEVERLRDWLGEVRVTPRFRTPLEARLAAG